MKTPLITREGYEKLKQELNYLWREERPEVTKKVTWAASLGDAAKMPTTSIIKSVCVRSTAVSVI